MKFGPVPIERAEGAILAHAVLAGDRRFRKAHVLTADDIAALRSAGVVEVIAAVLQSDDLLEDIAAETIAACLTSLHVEARPAATGRVNLHATATGVFTVDKMLVDAINAIDPAVTLATVPQHAPVEKGQMVATVKIIPFAVPRHVVESVTSLCKERETFAVKPLSSTTDRAHSERAAWNQGRSARQDYRASPTNDFDGLAAMSPPSLGRHTRQERLRQRSSRSANSCDMLVIFGASAMSDSAGCCAHGD